jgi:ribosome modulation factor
MPATIGDNSKHELTLAERKAIYFDHFNKIMRQTAICKAENEVRKTLRKEAKAAGIILSDIDFGMRCATIEDPQVVVDEQARRAEIGRFFALPIGSQVDFEFDREPAVDRAARQGEAAGYAGKDRDAAGYDLNSDQGRAWLAAWDDAQANMLADLAAGMEKANAKKAADAAAKDDDGSNDPDEDGDE